MTTKARHRFAQIFHLDEGVVFEREFDNERDAELFVMGARAALEALDDDSHGTCVNENHAEDEP